MNFFISFYVGHLLISIRNIQLKNSRTKYASLILKTNEINSYLTLNKSQDSSSGLPNSDHLFLSNFISWFSLPSPGTPNFPMRLPLTILSNAGIPYPLPFLLYFFSIAHNVFYSTNYVIALCNFVICFLLVVVQLLSHVRLFATLWTAAYRASCPSLSPGACSHSLLMLCNHLILCHPLFLLTSNFSSIRVFSSELALCIRWPKYLELQLQHCSFQ